MKKEWLSADKQSAVVTIDKEIETLEILKDLLTPELTKALDACQFATGRIILTGMGKSGIIGRKIAASLSSTGTPAFFVHPAEASHGDLGMITKGDVVIAISNSGGAKELVDIISYCKRFGIPLISITKNPDSNLGKAADILLLIPDNGEACPLGLAPTSSTTATLVLGDILTVRLIERKGFTQNDFNLRHPGGKLGATLQRVKDLMHTGDAMPILRDTVSIRQAILEMSSKRLGCVGFIDGCGCLTGMLTDGDLRRCLSDDILEKAANTVMTYNPKTIKAETLAAEALKMMNDMKITNFFVVEHSKPVGVIHIHDLL